MQPSTAQTELKFYEALMARLQQPAETLDLYSISACFGFYSSGMKVFSDVLQALRAQIRRPEPYNIRQLRILIKADDHLIDTFGLERFQLFLDVPAAVSIREMERPRDPAEWIQFAVFNGREVIFTTSQAGFRDDALGLGINKVSPAQAITREHDEKLVERYKKLFETSWDNGAKFEMPRLPSMEELVSRIRERFPVNKDCTEEQCEAELKIFLSAIIDLGLIHQQYQIGQHRLDLAIGDPKRRMLAIEVKRSTNDESEIKRWKGQVSSYREVVREVLLIVLGEGMTRQKRRDLESHFESDAGVRVVFIT